MNGDFIDFKLRENTSHFQIEKDSSLRVSGVIQHGETITFDKHNAAKLINFLNKNILEKNDDSES